MMKIIKYLQKGCFICEDETAPLL